MANGFLPQVFGQEVQPSPAIQSSMAGQAAARVAQRKAQRRAMAQQMPQVPTGQPSQLTPAMPAVPKPPQQAQPTFRPRPQAIDPNTVIARRPGGMVTVPTSTVVRSQQPTAEEIKANADVTEQQARYVGAQQELLEEKANWAAKMAETREKLVGIEQGSQARMMEIEKKKTAAIQDGVTKLNSLTEEVKGQKVKGFWADKSTFSRIMASIGVGMGGAAATIRGGPNYAFQVLQQAIEADLVKQKTNLKKRYSDIDAQRSFLSETSKLFENQIIAEEAARTASYRTVANELDTMASKAQSDEMRSKILEMSEAVKLQAAQSEQAFQQSLRADVTQQLATKVIPSKTITRGDVMTDQAKQQGYVDYKEMVKEKKVDTFVPAYGGFARYGKDDAQKLAVDARDRQATRNVLNKLIDFREKHGEWNVLNQKEKAYASALHNEMLLLKKGRSMADLGVLAGPDLELLLTSTPKPEDLFTYGAERYRAVVDTINDKERLDVQERIMPAIPESIPPAYRRGATKTEKKTY